MALKADPINLVISGVGGQGNLLLSRLIGRALIKKDYFVSIGETLGVAQRGGAVMSNVRISKKTAFGPLIPEGKAHAILSLEPLETLRMLARYGNTKVKTVTNFHPIFPVTVLSRKAEYPDYEALRQAITGLSQTAWFLDATEMGLKLGNPIVANIIMLGALIGLDLLPLAREEIEAEIKTSFSVERAKLNLKAFSLGIDTIKKQNKQ